MSKAPSVADLKARGKVSGLVKGVGASLPKFETRDEAEDRRKAQATQQHTTPLTQTDSAPQADTPNPTPTQHNPTLVSVPAGIDPVALARSRESYSSLQVTDSDRVVMVPLALIDKGEFQNRIEFDPTYIESLAENIRTDGLTNPVVLRPKLGGRFELIAGENRFEAHKLIGVIEIKAVIHDVDDVRAARLTVLDNFHRRDLSDYEKYNGMRILKKSGPATTVRAIADDTGLSKTQVQRLLSYERLPAECHDILRKNPLLLGANAAEKLAAHTDNGHGAIVLEALHLMDAKRLTETRADSWILNRTAPTNKVRTDRKVTTVAGKPFATLVRAGTGLAIKLENSVIDPGKVEELVFEALKQIADKEAAE